jgi:hypothetical protein
MPMSQRLDCRADSVTCGHCNHSINKLTTGFSGYAPENCFRGAAEGYRSRRISQLGQQWTLNGEIRQPLDKSQATADYSTDGCLS